MKFLSILALFFSFSVSAGVTGADLHRLLNGDDEDKMGAIGYIIGVMDVLNGSKICPKPDATLEQAVALVRSTLQTSDKAKGAPALNVVAVVLSNAWPCEKKLNVVQ